MYFHFLDVRLVNMIWYFLLFVFVWKHVPRFQYWSSFFIHILHKGLTFYFILFFYYCFFIFYFNNILFLTNVWTDDTFPSTEVLNCLPERSHTWAVFDVRLVARQRRVTLVLAQGLSSVQNVYIGFKRIRSFTRCQWSSVRQTEASLQPQSQCAHTASRQRHDLTLWLIVFFLSLINPAGVKTCTGQPAVTHRPVW